MKLDSIAKAYLQQIQLDEQLLPKEEADADKMKNFDHASSQISFIYKHPKARELFQNSPYMAPGSLYPRQFAARIPVELENPKNPDADVSDFLTRNGYHFTPEEYKSGVANRNATVGNPDAGIPYSTKTVTAKIGGLLDKHKAPDDIKKKFVNDLFRSNQKTKAYDIVLTGNHHDIYGSSTGRSWTSCADKRPRKEGEVPGWRANDGKGPAAQRIKGEINNNTFNAYLIPRGGDVDTQAIGRISFKRHTGVFTKHSTLFPEGQQYGTNVPSGFRKAAEGLVSSVFDRVNDVYVKNDYVYDDDKEKVKLHGQQEFSPEQLDAVHKVFSDDFDRMKLIKHVNPSLKYKTKIFRDFTKHVNNIKKSAGFEEAGAYIKNDINLPSGLHGFYYGENPHLQSALDHIASTFDLSNPAHHQAIKSLSSNYFNSSSIGQALIDKVTKNIKVKNYDDFKNISKLRELTGIRLGGGRYSALPLADQHNMGKDPMDHIIRTAGEREELDYPLLRDAYMTFHNHAKKRGNIYDVARHYENEGVHGADKSIKALGDDLRKKPAGDLAEIFYSMKPDTRERFASEIHSYIGGRTAKQFMQDNKAHIDAYKERRNGILKESYFEEDDSFGF